MQWGHHGTPDPGDFTCGGPVASYSGDFAMATSTKALVGYDDSMMTYLTIQSDVAN